jgi:hypothetical protein
MVRAHAPGTPGAPEPSWWLTRPWRRYLQDLLLYRRRRRYTLTVSEYALAGATDPAHRRKLGFTPACVRTMS